MNKHIFFLAGIISLSFLSCREARMHDKPEWGKYFEQEGIKSGCFMMQDQVHESVYFYNKERCTERFIPASTFKIFNSLVALETAVAPAENMIIKWDGIPRWNADWNRDMDMREAFKVSNVGYYQEIARRIGAQKMKQYLDTCHYGNQELSKIDTFWLDNSLRVSADEQLGMIKRMYFNQLKPFSDRSQRIVKSMMLREDSAELKIYYKTGWGKTPDKQVLWVVGFAEKIMNVKEHEKSMNKTNVRIMPYFFAMNFELAPNDTTKEWSQVRLTVLHNILRDFGVIKKS